MPRTKLNHTRVTLRLPPEHWKELKNQAAYKGTPLQDHLRSIIRQAVKPHRDARLDEQEDLLTAEEAGKWIELCNESGEDPADMARRALQCLERRIRGAV